MKHSPAGQCAAVRRWRGKRAPAMATGMRAIGLNARYVIGIWTGRPDGTPVAGQFGFASAVPLLNQVNNMLQSRSMVDEARLPRDPRPASVGRGVICWPGPVLPEGSENCRRRLSTAAGRQ